MDKIKPYVFAITALSAPLVWIWVWFVLTKIFSMLFGGIGAWIGVPWCFTGLAVLIISGGVALNNWDDLTSNKYTSFKDWVAKTYGEEADY